MSNKSQSILPGLALACLTALMALILTQLQPLTDSEATLYANWRLVASDQVPPRLIEPSAIDNNAIISSDTIGSERSFWVANGPDGTYNLIRARLQDKNDKFLIWVEVGQEEFTPAIITAAEFVYDRLSERLLGTEFSAITAKNISVWPVQLLFTKMEAQGGYFSSNDLQPAGESRFSNQANIVYISLAYCNHTDGCSSPIIAHELQHLFQHYLDPQEKIWMNEGFSELAGVDLGEKVSYPIPAIAKLPLLSWDNEIIEGGDYYAAAASFLSSWRRQLSDTALNKIIISPWQSRAAFQKYLWQNGINFGFDQFFAKATADFIQAAENEEISKQISPWYNISEPASIADELPQYSCAFYRLDSTKKAKVYFRGITQQPLLPFAEPVANEYWWSGHATQGESTLSATLDLRSLDQASLHFLLWYDTEPLYDWGYLLISSIDGTTHKLVRLDFATDADPYGTNPGWAFTGKSEGWRDVTVNLTPYCRQTINIQFGYRTDDATEAAGVYLASLSVPELAGSVNWSSKGFVRIDPGAILPQHYLVLSYRNGDGQFDSMKDLPLRTDNSGVWYIPSSTEKRTLAVCAISNESSERAPYTMQINYTK